MVDVHGGAGAAPLRDRNDLHLHSDRSDGTTSPREVMRAASDHGIRIAALTDHDTTSGWDEAAVAAQELGMSLLPGMELSARLGHRSVHILGYLFDPEDADLRAITDRIRESRHTRARSMVEAIACDFPVDLAALAAHTAPGATVGRPHIADALISAGVVADREEAFASILHPAGPYYVALYAPDPVTAVRAITAAGGVAIIAHPAGRSGLLPDDALSSMLDAGLAGFELGHRENLEPGVRVLRRHAAEHDLIITGSSDYHGAGKPNRPGEFTTSDEMVARIIARATGSAPVLA